MVVAKTQAAAIPSGPRAKAGFAGPRAKVSM